MTNEPIKWNGDSNSVFVYDKLKFGKSTVVLKKIVNNIDSKCITVSSNTLKYLECIKDLYLKRKENMFNFVYVQLGIIFMFLRLWKFY